MFFKKKTPSTSSVKSTTSSTSAPPEAPPQGPAEDFGFPAEDQIRNVVHWPPSLASVDAYRKVPSCYLHPLPDNTPGKQAKDWKIFTLDKPVFKKLDYHVQPYDYIPEAVRSKKYNRFLDILPVPATAVKLEGADEISRYVNANYIRGPNGNPKYYISAMGPLPATIVNFWEMVIQNNIVTVIMATGLVEKKKRKCARYFPRPGQTVQYGDISIAHQSEALEQGFVRTTLKVTSPAGTRIVHHFWLKSWPDHGIPKDDAGNPYPDDIVGMLRQVHEHQLSQTSSAPILVHCSAGAGRTGSIISIDFSAGLLEVNGEVDLLSLIETLRDDRVAMVQHDIQYELVHQACMLLAKKSGHNLRIIDHEHSKKIRPKLKSTVPADDESMDEDVNAEDEADSKPPPRPSYEEVDDLRRPPPSNPAPPPNTATLPRAPGAPEYAPFGKSKNVPAPSEYEYVNRPAGTRIIEEEVITDDEDDHEYEYDDMDPTMPSSMKKASSRKKKPAKPSDEAGSDNVYGSKITTAKKPMPEPAQSTYENIQAPSRPIRAVPASNPMPPEPTDALYENMAIPARETKPSPPKPSPPKPVDTPSSSDSIYENTHVSRSQQQPVVHPTLRRPKLSLTRDEAVSDIVVDHLVDETLKKQFPDGQVPKDTIFIRIDATQDDGFDDMFF